MARAFLLEPARADFNLSSIEKYGSISLLFPAGFPTSLGQPEMIETTILDRLHQVDYDCCEDYFVVAGKLGRIACLMGIAGSNYERVKLLLYNDRTGEYTPAEFCAPSLNS